MRRFINLTLTLLLTALSLAAERITPTRALSIANAESAKPTRGYAGKMNQAGVRFSKVSVAADAYYVVTTDTEKGFAIVGADDALPSPVAAYSPDQRFPADEKNLPPQLKAWLHDYSAIVKAVADGKLNLRSSGEALKGEAVEPLMKTKWNQDMPYNNLTPEFGQFHAPTGCVATAATQVMKYFNFPKRGKGSVAAYPYHNSENNYIDLSDHILDWENMLDNYEVAWDPDNQKYIPKNFNETQAAAVATLMRDFGYAVEMAYGKNESGAQSSYVLPVLVRHFSYSPEAIFSFRWNQSEAEWNQEIRRSLLAGSPVLYSGSDGKYGHEFVCDGIDENGLLHINWGWGGVSNGYFDMNILSPDNLGIGAGNGAYYKEQDVLLFLKPGNEEADYSDYRSPITLSNIAPGYRAEDGKLDSRTSNIMTARLNNSSGAVINGNVKYFLSLYDKDNKLVYQNREAGQSNINLSIAYYYSSRSFFFDDGINSAEIPDGEYKVIPQYAYINRDDGDKLGETRDFTKDREYLRLTVKNGDFYLDKLETADKPTIAITGARASLLIADIEKDFPVTIDLKSITDTYQQNAYFNFCLVHEKEDTGSMPTSDDIRWNYCSEALYPGISLCATGQVYARHLKKPGRYRLYFKQNEIDITPQEPIWVTAIESPTDGFVLMEPLLNLEVELSEYLSLWTRIIPFIPSRTFEGEIQMWAYPESGSPEEALPLFTSAEPLKSDESCWIGGTVDIMMEKPLGRYVVFLKYKSGNDWKIVPGESNRGTLDFTDPGDESRLLLLSKKAKLGSAEAARPGDEIEVEYHLTCRKEIRLTDPGIMLVAYDTENPDAQAHWLGHDELSISSLQIDKGEEFTIKGTVTLPVNIDCGAGKTYLLTPYITDNSEGNTDYFYKLRSYPFAESVKLRIEPYPAEHVDITVDGFDQMDQFLPGDETAYIYFRTYMTNNAENPLTHTRINFFPVPISQESATPDLEGKPHGTYIPSDFQPGESLWLSIDMRGDMFPDYGLYRIYVTYEDMGKQVIAEGVKPLYVNIADSNSDVMVFSIADEQDKYLEPDVNLNIDLSLGCAAGYYGPLELWARPYWGGKELKIAAWNTTLAAGATENLELELPTDVFLNKPFGPYLCHFKVMKEGEMIKAGGEKNIMVYNVAGIKTGTPILELCEEVSLSPGSDLTQGKETEISLKMYAYGPMRLDYTTSRILLVDTESNETINAETGALEGPAEIKEGSFITLKAKVKLPVNASADGKKVEIVPVLTDPDRNFCRLRTYSYAHSLFVKQKYSSGVSDIRDNGSNIRIAGNILTLSGADAGSYLRIYTAGGALCREHRVTGSRMEFDLTALPQGIYIVNATVGKRARSLKFTK